MTVEGMNSIIFQNMLRVHIDVYSLYVYQLEYKKAFDTASIAK